jgi:hypothetical protein
MAVRLMIENLIVITAGVAIVGYILDRKTQQKIQYESDTYVATYTRKFNEYIQKFNLLRKDDSTKNHAMQIISGDEKW